MPHASLLRPPWLSTLALSRGEQDAVSTFRARRSSPYRRPDRARTVPVQTRFYPEENSLEAADGASPLWQTEPEMEYCKLINSLTHE
jgi:hypothetical protein